LNLVARGSVIAGVISRASDGSECRVGYLLVPSFGGEESFNPEKAAGFAKQLNDHVRRLDEMGASGWIVDLRFNSGGDMWPMLAGVGPLLNGNRVGAFVREGEEEDAKWDVRRTSDPKKECRGAPPRAVFAWHATSNAPPSRGDRRLSSIPNLSAQPLACPMRLSHRRKHGKTIGPLTWRRGGSRGGEG
jgi:hypothetical protein